MKCIASILFTLVVSIHATEAQDKSVEDALNELFERALKVSTDHADLDESTLGKPAGAAMMQRQASIPMAQPLGRRDAALAIPMLGALATALLTNEAQALVNTEIKGLEDKSLQKKWAEGITRRDDAMSPGNMVRGKDITEVPNVFLKGMNQRYDGSKAFKYKDDFKKTSVASSKLPGSANDKWLAKEKSR